MKLETALRHLAEVQMRPFNQNDWDCFGNICESNEPMIGFVNRDEQAIVLDGTVLSIHGDEGVVDAWNLATGTKLDW